MDNQLVSISIPILLSMAKSYYGSRVSPRAVPYQCGQKNSSTQYIHRLNILLTEVTPNKAHYLKKQGKDSVINCWQYRTEHLTPNRTIIHW